MQGISTPLYFCEGVTIEDEVFISHGVMVKATTDHRELLADPAIDAIAIATPVSTHFDLAMQALHAGKHVLVEKTAYSNIRTR